jgi:ketosteroid isomerase-like protein
MSAQADAGDVVRTYFQAYPARDRAAIEGVVAEDFHFTSPLDNRIDRRTYFERCWPNGDDIAELNLQYVVVSGERVFAAYEIRMKDGRRFKNAELLTVQRGRITDVEVYFGWTIPHKAPVGGFVPDEK